jgi:peptidoglycan/xylan/chitin deacetylase (PgdA/CDA1 family)
MVSDNEVPHVRHLYRFRNVGQFTNDLDVFLAIYRPISLHELLDSLRIGTPLPRNSFLLTFDDGFREMYDVVAPVLLRKGIPATFFLTTAFLNNLDIADHSKISLLLEHLERMGAKAPVQQVFGILSTHGLHGTNVQTALLPLSFYRKKQVVEEIATLLEYDFKAYLSQNQPYLTSEQIRKLIGMGFTIGAHSVDHPPYSMLALEEQLAQTRASVGFLQKCFSLKYSAFAFPFFDDNVPEQYFREIFAKREVDVSFGSAGMLKEKFPRHYQRFSVEHASAPAENTIARHYARGLYKRLIGRQLIKRR